MMNKRRYSSLIIIAQTETLCLWKLLYPSLDVRTCNNHVIIVENPRSLDLVRR